MATLHSFDEEPERFSVIHAIDHVYRARITFISFGENLFALEGSSCKHDWEEMKEFFTTYKGWLYESELMQLIKQGVSDDSK